MTDVVAGLKASIFIWYDMVQDNFVLALPGLPEVRLGWSQELDQLANQALTKFAADVHQAANCCTAAAYEAHDRGLTEAEFDDAVAEAERAWGLKTEWDEVMLACKEPGAGMEQFMRLREVMAKIRGVA